MDKDEEQRAIDLEELLDQLNEFKEWVQESCPDETLRVSVDSALEIIITAIEAYIPAHLWAYCFTGEDTKLAKRTIRFEKLLELVCEAFDVTKAEIKGRRRRFYLAPARQALMWLARNYARSRRYKTQLMTYQEIAHELDRDHSSIVHGCQQAETKRKEDKEYNEIITSIENIIKHGNKNGDDENE